MSEESKTASQILYDAEAHYKKEIELWNTLTNELEEKNKKLELNLHNAEVLLKVASNELERLQENYADLEESSTELFVSEQKQQTRASKAESKIVEALNILDAYDGDMEVLNQIRKVLTQKYPIFSVNCSLNARVYLT